MRSPPPTVVLARTRAGMRPVAWLLLTLLLLQAGAQWCAAHCGIASFGAGVSMFDAADAAGVSDRIGDVPAASSVSAPGVPGPADDRSASAEAPCTLAAWCELGQASLLPTAVAGSLPGRVTVPIRSPAIVAVLFQNMPGDRPPTA